MLLKTFFLCETIGITVEAYAPLGSPGRMGAEESDPIVMEDPVITEMATKKGVTPAQVCNSNKEIFFQNFH